MGNALGKPGDAATQTSILTMALALAESAETGGVLEDAPLVWPEPLAYAPKAG